MDRTHRAKERIKTCLIVVLTLSAVLLLSFYWADFSLRTVFAEKAPIDNPPHETPDAPKTREILSPIEIQVNIEGVRGGLRATLFPEEQNAWEIMTMAFVDFSRSEEANLEEITESSYHALIGARSLRAVFLYDLPFDGFCKQFNIASAPFAGIETMRELVFSTAAPDSLFLYDAPKNTYYRLVGDAEKLENCSSLINDTSLYSKDLVYTITDTLGEENSALIPMEYAGTTKKAKGEKLIHEEKRDVEADRFARLFFDNSLDFVRRVEDTKGLLTYIYNYSQKILTVTKSGVAEYREELADADVTQGFYTSLGTALSFVAEHGGWYPTFTGEGAREETDSGKALKPYLIRAVNVSADHRNGYRFAFGFRTDEALFFYDDLPITVDVYDGQVTYYRRALIEKVDVSETGENDKEAITPANAIAKNSEWAYAVLSEAGVLEKNLPPKERFRAVACALTQICYAYFLPSTAEEDVIAGVPVWMMRAGDVLLYVDLYTGEPVSYRIDAK